ncbi:hypothetical protein PHO31112_00792 [Pandoraea horticolens]|uniref:Phage protein n=1 Tax=Pandoraea horticolens TaxID=2508298 RepID=A0A5E4SJN5_9BURK|nr:hypothetical protein [Pandoraea horticolens]VVD75012.1 hypothetical protein PHO31112_00792 [Pandoraea horticolens]
MPINWGTDVLGPLMGVFGEPVQYRPRVGAPLTIYGVFDDAYQKEMLFSDASVELTTVQAVLGVQLSQFSMPPAQNDQLTVVRTGGAYVVKDVRVDSHGGAKLILSKMGAS